MIREIAAAIAFLTRLPVGRRFEFDARAVARAARWFPLVGALLGGIYWGALGLLANIFPSIVVATLLVGLDAWLTGAMHLDGLADTADGFGGGRSPDEVLRIMRDHAIGSYGAVALFLCLALKTAAIAALIDAQRGAGAVFLAPILGRWSAVLLAAGQPYARPPEHDTAKSVGSPARFVGRAELIVATIIALAAAAARDRGRAAIGLVAVAGFTIVWGRSCRRRIGGVTGDTLGAAIVVSECLIFLAFLAAPL